MKYFPIIFILLLPFATAASTTTQSFDISIFQASAGTVDYSFSDKNLTFGSGQIAIDNVSTASYNTLLGIYYMDNSTSNRSQPQSAAQEQGTGVFTGTSCSRNSECPVGSVCLNNKCIDPKKALSTEEKMQAVKEKLFSTLLPDNTLEQTVTILREPANKFAFGNILLFIAEILGVSILLIILITRTRKHKADFSPDKGKEHKEKKKIEFKNYSLKSIFKGKKQEAKLKTL